MRSKLDTIQIGLIVLTALLVVACSNVAPKGPSPKPPPTLPIEEMTLEQAQQIAHFHILEPRYLLTGLHLQRVLYYPGTYFVLIYAYSDPGEQSPNSGFLDITEGEYYEIPIPSGGSPLGPTPVLPNRPTVEIVMIRGMRANVERFNSPLAWNPAAPASGEYITLSWHTNTIAFSLTGSQDLPELVRIAESLE